MEAEKRSFRGLIPSVSRDNVALWNMSAAESDDAVKSAELSPGLAAIVDRLESQGGRLLSASEVVAMRGAKAERAAQSAPNLDAGRTVFGIQIGRHWRYPSFQFYEDGEVHKGVGAVLNILPDNFEGWPLLDWFVTHQPVLLCSPAQLLRVGTKEEQEANLRKLVALAKYQLLEPLA